MFTPSTNNNNNNNNNYFSGNAFEDVDTYHDSIEEKQNKTLKNLEEIQETIAFMSNVCIYSIFILNLVEITPRLNFLISLELLI